MVPSCHSATVLNLSIRPNAQGSIYVLVTNILNLPFLGKRVSYLTDFRTPLPFTHSVLLDHHEVASLARLALPMFVNAYESTDELQRAEGPLVFILKFLF